MFLLYFRRKCKDRILKNNSLETHLRRKKIKFTKVDLFVEKNKPSKIEFSIDMGRWVLVFLFFKNFFF
jgi:hypothetical protein